MSWTDILSWVDILTWDVLLYIFLAIWIWLLKRQNKKLKRGIGINDQATDFFLRKLERERNKDCDCHR